MFKSKTSVLDLRWVCHSESHATKPEIKVRLEKLKGRDMLGEAAVADFSLTEGQIVYFVLREMPEEANRTRDWIDKQAAEESETSQALGVSIDQFREAAHLLRPACNPIMSVKLLETMVSDTSDYWNRWISRCKYRGRWREAVRRSALTL